MNDSEYIELFYRWSTTIHGQCSWPK